MVTRFVALDGYRPQRAVAGIAHVYMLRWAGKLYVGSSVNLASRMYWWRKQLHGVFVEVRLLDECSVNDRHAREAFFIDKFKTFDNGHNTTANGKAGGIVGRIVSETAKQKISVKNTGKKRTDEAKQKMRAAKLGKAQTPEHIEARRLATVGKKRSAQARANIGASLTGKPKSEAHKAALKEAWMRRKAKVQQTVKAFAFGYGAK